MKKKLLLAGILLALLYCAVLPVALARQGQATQNATAAPRGKASGRPFPVTFTDTGKAAGLSMRFLSGGEESKRYIIEANGTGVAFFDYDNDGREDIFLVNGSSLDRQAPKGSNHLYRNLGHGKFQDVTEPAGLEQGGWGNGVCVGDLNNDGFDDLFITYLGPNKLYINDGKGKFSEVSEKSGLTKQAHDWSSGCTFIDYDRDGHLDLLVTSYQQFDFASAPPPGKGSNCEWKGMPVFCGPRGLPYGKVTLYHNRGDNTFEDVSEKSGIRSTEGFYAFTAVAADLNEDGWPDIYIACDSTPSLFFRNNGNGTFSELGTETGLAFNEHGFEQGGMGIAVADFDNDGRLDLLKTNFAGDYPNLFHNTGKGIFEDVVLRAGLAVNPQYVGWGVGFVDLDNDGWKDILQVNGHVYPELDRAKLEEKYRNPRLVYRNLSNGVFEDMSGAAGPAIQDRHSSRGAAFGDFDNDGDMDAVVMNMGETPSLLRNDLKSTNHWLKLLLTGTRSNRDAIGAIAIIESAGLRQMEPVLSQSSFISANDRRLHFGLGQAASVDRILVQWPNGTREQFPGTAANRLVRLTEGTGKIENVPLPE